MANLRILVRRLILHVVLQHLPQQVEVLYRCQPRIMILLRVDLNVDAHQRVYTGECKQYIEQHNNARFRSPANTLAYGNEQKIAEQWYRQIEPLRTSEQQ